MSTLAFAPRTLGPLPSIVVEERAGLTVSAHAQKRLLERAIELTDADWSAIQSAVAAAANKSAKKALVLMKKAALVVSVPNRAVITVMDPDAMRENVFLNIDSAVIV